MMVDWWIREGSHDGRGAIGLRGVLGVGGSGELCQLSCTYNIHSTRYCCRFPSCLQWEQDTGTDAILCLPSYENDCERDAHQVPVTEEVNQESAKHWEGPDTTLMLTTKWRSKMRIYPLLRTLLWNRQACAKSKKKSTASFSTSTTSKVKTCSCKTRKTPLWRDSEDGTPYCNACGIRYKKYRVRCPVCSYIPHKDENINNVCCICGADLVHTKGRASCR